MKSVLVLQEMDGKRFKIAYGAQIGRSPELTWCVPERQRPADCDLLEVAVQVSDAPATMSRNHCGLIPAPGGFCVIDLNSLNGTALNGRILTPGVRHAIRVGDTLDLTSYRLIVLQREEEGQNHHAVIVGAVEPLAADRFPAGATRFKQLLEPRGFANNVGVLVRSTKGDLLTAISALERLATIDSHVLFYFHGRCTAEGLVCASERGDETVSPTELFAAFANVRGKKALLLDAAGAEIFVASENAVPSDTLVIASASSAGIESIGLESGLGLLGEGLIEYLRLDPHRLDLDDVSAWFNQQGRAVSWFKSPRVLGCRYTLQSVHFALPLTNQRVMATQPGRVCRPTAKVPILAPKLTPTEDGDEH